MYLPQPRQEQQQWRCYCQIRVCTGINADTSPIFWLGGTLMRIPSNIITYFKFSTSEFTEICHFEITKQTRNTVDCYQSNYSSSIVYSHIPIEFGQTGISAIRSADPENPTVEPNMKWIGRPLAEIWPFEIFPNVRSVGRRSVLNILLLTLISYTHLCYARNVARGVKNWGWDTAPHQIPCTSFGASFPQP